MRALLPADSISRKLALSLLLAMSLGLAGCGDDGDDGDPGPPGADGSDGLACWDLNENGVKDLPDEDLNGDGVVDVNDCNANTGGIVIGDGSDLTEEQIEELGQLEATIDKVTVSSAPVVEFTVKDSHGRPAIGIASNVVLFTFAKLMPGDPDVNGGIPHWQSYINRIERANDADTPNVLPQAVQATNDRGGQLESLGGGKYRYTFANDVTNITSPIAVPWEPSLTHRVGLEIRLSGEGEVPLAPDNPVYDFVPDGGAGTGHKEIADTANCNDCHYSFALHGGPRKTVEYCVTCHNPGSIDQDTGESIDMAYLAHSIHTGEDRAVPYIIYGFGDTAHDYSEVGYPQDTLYCETCHTASDTHPDGDSWNEVASVKTCGGCHAGGLVAENPDSVTGLPEYKFDHAAAGADLDAGVVEDGACGNCHIDGNIERAGPALAIHSRVRGSARARKEAGDNFVMEILSATNTGPGQTPMVTFKVSDTDGNAYDIVNDPEFTDSNASLNLYVAWTTDDIYNGDENGATGGWRDQGNGPQSWDPGHPYRMYLAALQRDAVKNGDGSYTVKYFRALPQNISGDPMIALGGHPAWKYRDADGVTDWDRAAAVSAVFYPGDARAVAFDSAQCNACHERLQLHGGNRNGNAQICLVCHNADTVAEGEGWAFGRMIHSIHSASTSFFEGEFEHVTYPQNIANCMTCHKDGSYNAARATARAVSTNAGADEDVWTDDIATTATAAACGVCHTSTAARGHFEATGSAQINEVKANIIGAEDGLPNGQEGCLVCHGPGREFDTVQYHNPGVGE